jgi:molybdopterin-guanine dinucleotide biosynthesis protein A
MTSAHALGGHPPWTAVVLDGGRASRLGGIDKPGLDVGGASLRRRAVAAVADADRVLLVGPPAAEDGALLGDRVARVLEVEGYGGPLSALAAAVPAIATDVVVVLAADLVDPDPLPGALLTALAELVDADAVVSVGPDGRPQWLVSAYRTAALRSTLDEMASDAPLHGRRFADLLDVLGWAPVRTAAVRDVDTPDDLAAARAATTQED